MQEILDLVRSVLRGVWTYRWWGLATAVLVGLIGVPVVMSVPNQFEATARVYVDTQSILKPLMSGLAVQPNIDQQVSMVSRTLLSRPNVERVIRMADLDLKVKSQQERDALVDMLMTKIQFAVAGGTNLYSIGLRSTEPEQSRKVVQALLSLFVEANLGDKRRDSDQARKFIDEQIKVYERRLEEAETRLKEFRIRNILQMSSLGPDSVGRAGDLQGQAAQARMELSQAENARDELKKQLSIEPQQVPDDRPLFDYGGSSGGGNSAAAPVRRSQYDDRIDAQRRRLDELRLRFTEEHPDVLGAKRVIEQLEAARDAERKAEAARPDPNAKPGEKRQPGMVPNPVYQQLRVSLAETEATVASLRARVRDLEARIIQVRTTATTMPKIEAEYQQLNRDYDTLKQNYTQLVSRRESAQISGEMDASAQMAEFRVVDPPRVSPTPVFPNRPLLLIGVLAASIVAGIAAAFLRDQIRPTFFDLRALRQVTEMPVFGAVSWISDAAARARSRRGVLVFSGSTVVYLGLFAAVLGWQWLKQFAK